MTRSLLEVAQSVCIEVLDRDPEIGRVFQSGAWPAFVVDLGFWTPRRVLAGWVPRGLFPAELWPPLLDYQSGTSRGAQLHSFANRPSFSSDLVAVEYGPQIRGSFTRTSRNDDENVITILVDPADETGALDWLGLTKFSKPRILEDIVPGPEVLRRWKEVDRELAERTKERRRAKAAAEKEREKTNSRLCRALLDHLAREAFACPHCRRSAREYRFFDSYFVCWSCGRSFFPVDLPAGSIASRA